MRWKFWRRPRRPLSGEVCARCYEPLRIGGVYEFRKAMVNLGDPLEAGGGTYMACAYCKQHAPEGARRL